MAANPSAAAMIGHGARLETASVSSGSVMAGPFWTEELGVGI
jgi:hypothetical protein